MKKSFIDYDLLVTFAYRDHGGDVAYYKGIKYSLEDIKLKIDQYEIKDNMEQFSIQHPLSSIEKGIDDKTLDFIKKRREKMELNSKGRSWFSRQRRLRRDGKLDDYKIDELNRLGMLWNPTTDVWEKIYKEIRDNGITDEEEFWVKEQRKLYAEGLMPDENMIRLKAIGFNFDSNFNEKFNLSYYQLSQLEDLFEHDTYTYHKGKIGDRSSGNSPPKLL